MKDLLKELAKLKITRQQIHDILNHKEKHWTVSYIRKKRGKRRICQPSPELKQLQRTLNSVVFYKYKVSKFNTAYECSCSTYKNAAQHINAKYMLKVDIADFFQSISYGHLQQLLRKHYSTSDIRLIWDIISYRDVLAIGSCCAPFVANRIMLDCDKQIAKSAKKCVYTRYADDMTFSSKNQIDSQLPNIINQILYRQGMQLNKTKTRFIRPGQSLRVTGLTISHKNRERVTVGHKYKATLKKQIYNYVYKKEGDLKVILGKLGYVESIEPGYRRILGRKYGM